MSGDLRSSPLSISELPQSSSITAFSGPRVLGRGRSEQTGELNEAKVDRGGDRNVSLEVTPAKLKVSGIVGPVGLIKWIEFPFTLGSPPLPP